MSNIDKYIQKRGPAYVRFIQSVIPHYSVAKGTYNVAAKRPSVVKKFPVFEKLGKVGARVSLFATIALKYLAAPLAEYVTKSEFKEDCEAISDNERPSHYDLSQLEVEIIKEHDKNTSLLSMEEWWTRYSCTVMTSGEREFPVPRQNQLVCQYMNWIDRQLGTRLSFPESMRNQRAPKWVWDVRLNGRSDWGDRIRELEVKLDKLSEGIEIYASAAARLAEHMLMVQDAMAALWKRRDKLVTMLREQRRTLDTPILQNPGAPVAPESSRVRTDDVRVNFRR